MAKSYAPTEAMKNNARRGLALREKYNRGGLSTTEAGEEGVGSGVARARDIIDGNLSLDSVKRMYAFFSRHQKNYDPKKRMPDGGPTAGTIAWLIWGGSAGQAWARRILREEQILKSYTKEILDSDLEQEDQIPFENIQVAKAIEPELKQVTFVAMKPGIDSHKDYVSLSEIRKAKESFNKQLSAQRKLANLWHIYPTDKFEIIESYLLPADATLNGTFVEKGTWLVSLQILDDEMWELIKSNEINGVSIGAVAKVQNIDEE